MKKAALFLLSLALASGSLWADSTWELASSTLTYHAFHTMHNSTGVTSASKGKGLCKESGCDFLIAVPVNTFRSGDANRDLHMLQAVNGATHPMISVRLHLPSEPAAPGFKGDVEVDFGGRKNTYPGVSFAVQETTPGLFLAKGSLPLILTQHDVKRPALLGVPIKDEVPVDIETSWRKK